MQAAGLLVKVPIPSDRTRPPPLLPPPLRPQPQAQIQRVVPVNGIGGGGSIGGLAPPASQEHPQQPIIVPPPSAPVLQAQLGGVGFVEGNSSVPNVLALMQGVEAPLKKRKKGGGDIDIRRGTLLNVSSNGRLGRRVRPRAGPNTDQDRVGFVLAKSKSSSKLVCQWFGKSGEEGWIVEEKVRVCEG